MFKRKMNTSAYLTRIDYSGPLRPDIDTLRGLHRAHLYRVPFENLDIHLGRPIRLEEDALFDKIVTRRRGGFCYELNGLFACLLEALGYTVTLLNARGVNDDGSYAIEFDHLALLVRCPGDPETDWLADIGFGSGPLEPLRLVEGIEQRQGERLFRLVREQEYLVLEEQVSREGQRKEWLGHYAFTLKPRVYKDFFPACRYHSSSPQSMFTQKRLCTLFLPDGRATLSENRLIITRDGTREERVLSGEDEERQVLQEVFGVELKG
jgi:N-hydroxyarylamine O-acetyltransferase